MNETANDAIERTRVREVAGIFHSKERLEAAAESLLLAGFDRADIDRLADLDQVRKRLGPVFVAHEELADIGKAPRQPVIVPEDMSLTMALVVSVLGAFGGVFTALVIVISGGSTAAAVGGAVLAAVIGCSLGVLLTLHFLRPARSRALEPQLEARGIVLWVRIHSPEQEEKARQILHLHGGEAIRVHEIEVEKLPEDLPLSSLRPDPWLGNERLGLP